MWYLIIFIWLSGAVLSYLYTRSSFTEEFNEWTVSDRSKALVLSLGSWLSLIITWKIMTRDNDRPASWCLIPLALCLLTSCSKEYSHEKTCIEYTTINWEDGETMKSWRQVDRPLRNDTSYSIGSARPAVVIVKTECK